MFWGESMDTNEKTKMTVRIALFTALAAVLTIFPHFPTPTGYVHFGDSAIYIAAAFFGPISGAIVGGIGHSLADLISGYPIYIPITLVIKAIMGYVTGKLLYSRLTTGRIIITALINLIIVTFGYFIPEVFLFGFASACAVFVSSPIQWLMSVIAFAILHPMMNKAKKYLK